MEDIKETNINSIDNENNHTSEVAVAGRMKHGLYIIINILLGTIVYFNSLKGAFHYDDNHVLNKVNTVLSITNLRFTGWLTFFINSLTGKTNAFYYHLTNLFIHLCIGICIYFVVRLLVEKKETLLPFIVSAIFLVHPLTTEPVNYVTARFAQLATLFSLLTMVSFISYTRNKKTAHAVLSVIFFIAGVYSKEVGIFYVSAGIFIYSVFFVEWKKLFSGAIKKLAWAGLLAFIIIFIFKFIGITKRLVDPDILKYFLIQNEVFVLKYLKLMVFPIGQSVDHQVIPPANFMFDPVILSCLALNIGIILFALLIRKRERIISFSIAWIYLMGLPYFFLVSSELVVEYRAYPMIFGYALLLGNLLESRVPAKRNQVVVFSFIILFFSVLTVNRNSIWNNDMRLWQDAIKKYPDSARAYCNFGIGCKEKGLYNMAIDAFNRSLELKFRYPYAVYMNRGTVYGEKGLYDEAIADFNEALKMNPQGHSVYNNRANAYEKKGLDDKAIADLNNAIKLYSRNEFAYYLRGKIYEKKGMYDKAISDMEMALKINPSNSNAWFICGNAYLETGNSDEANFGKAIFCYRKAIFFDPDMINAYNNLGAAYTGKGLYDEAIRSFSKAISISPGYLSAYKNRALVYKRIGKNELAEQDMIKAGKK